MTRVDRRRSDDLSARRFECQVAHLCRPRTPCRRHLRAETTPPQPLCLHFSHVGVPIEAQRGSCLHNAAQAALDVRAAQLEVQSGAAHLISNIYSRPERIGLRVVRTALNRSRTSATQQPQLKQPWPRQEARTCWRCGRSRKRRRTSTMRCNQVRRTCATPHSPLPPARFATWRHCARARARPRALVHMLPRERWCAWLRRADASASVLLRTRGHPRRTLARCGAGAMAVCLTPSLCRTASPEQRSPRW